MQRLQDSLIRIIKGPTGGFLASLGIAAVLGGVALASPAPPIADVTGHHVEVVAADPLGSYPTSSGVVASGVATVTGGVQTDADPTGRGPALDPAQNRPGPNTTNGSGSAGGGVRSAGLTPAHQDARDDPNPDGSTNEGPHHEGSAGGPGSGSGSGSGGRQHDPGSGQNGQGSASHQGGKGTGSNSGSGGNGSGERGDGGGSGNGGSGADGAGSGGSGGGDNTTNGHSAR